MIKNAKTKLIITLVVIAASIYAFYPPKEKINLGLDLKGGMHLVLEVQTGKVVAQELDQYADRVRNVLKEKNVTYESVKRDGQKITISGIPEGQFRTAEDALTGYYQNTFKMASHYEGGAAQMTMEMDPAVVRQLEDSAVQQSLETLRRRIDAYGVAEPTLQRFGSSEDNIQRQIIVELPGVDNPEEVKELIKKTASLTLNMVHPSAPFAVSRQAILDAFGGKIPDGYELVPYIGDYGAGKAGAQEEYILVKKAPVITGKHMTNARATQESNLGLSRPAVNFTLNSEGARRFGEATGANIGRQLAIILDGKAISAPRIDAKITDSGVITGLNSAREAEILALSLRSGALPADITILEERTVGPSLGLESIRKGVNASFLGLGLIILAMVVYYRLSGINAILCLLINLIILMGALGYLKGTLTLPGIAGIILTIGMAVDANVLIFERIREELALGKTVRASVEAGFSKAALTIMDSNITTLIAAAFLYQFGTGPIRGFAVTLTAGLLANLFTAIFVSRALFEAVLDRYQVKKLSI